MGKVQCKQSSMVCNMYVCISGMIIKTKQRCFLHKKDGFAKTGHKNYMGWNRRKNDILT